MHASEPMRRVDAPLVPTDSTCRGNLPERRAAIAGYRASLIALGLLS